MPQRITYFVSPILKVMVGVLLTLNLAHSLEKENNLSTRILPKGQTKIDQYFKSLKRPRTENTLIDIPEGVFKDYLIPYLTPFDKVNFCQLNKKLCEYFVYYYPLINKSLSYEAHLTEALGYLKDEGEDYKNELTIKYKLQQSTYHHFNVSLKQMITVFYLQNREERKIWKIFNRQGGANFYELYTLCLQPQASAARTKAFNTLCWQIRQNKFKNKEITMLFFQYLTECESQQLKDRLIQEFGDNPLQEFRKKSKFEPGLLEDQRRCRQMWKRVSSFLLKEEDNISNFGDINYGILSILSCFSRIPTVQREAFLTLKEKVLVNLSRQENLYNFPQNLENKKYLQALSFTFIHSTVPQPLDLEECYFDYKEVILTLPPESQFYPLNFVYESLGYIFHHGSYEYRQMVFSLLKRECLTNNQQIRDKIKSILTSFFLSEEKEKKDHLMTFLKDEDFFIDDKLRSILPEILCNAYCVNNRKVQLSIYSYMQEILKVINEKTENSVQEFMLLILKEGEKVACNSLAKDFFKSSNEDIRKIAWSIKERIAKETQEH